MDGALRYLVDAIQAADFLNPLQNKLCCEKDLKYLKICINQVICGGDLNRARMIAVHLKEYCWEKLNTGSWHEVDDCWRNMYAICTLLSIACDLAEKPDLAGLSDDIRKRCDYGILLGGSLLEPLFNTILDKMDEADDLQRLSPDEASSDESVVYVDVNLRVGSPVATERRPSLERFLNEFYTPQRPVLLLDCMDSWPALQKWSMKFFLKKIGNRTVPIEIGSNYARDSWTQKLMLFKDFIKEYVSNPNPPDVGYLAQHPLLDQVPSLKADVRVPEYCSIPENDDVLMNMWIGPAATVSPLHQDPRPNFLCQVKGKKYIRLIDSKYRDRLYPFDSNLLSNTSQVDVENPDYEKFPLAKGIPCHDCILKPGSMLYIPPLYWHYVRSLSKSISVNIWFG